MQDDETTESSGLAPAVGPRLDGGVRPLEPAAWMEPGKHWTLEHEEWMAHHRKDAHPNVQATLAAKTERLYALAADEVAAVNKLRARKVWQTRQTHLCRCDHNEYCQHCWPESFRPGGVWHGLGA